MLVLPGNAIQVMEDCFLSTVAQRISAAAVFKCLAENRIWSPKEVFNPSINWHQRNRKKNRPLGTAYYNRFPSTNPSSGIITGCSSASRTNRKLTLVPFFLFFFFTFEPGVSHQYALDRHYYIWRLLYPVWTAGKIFITGTERRGREGEGWQRGG